MKGQDLLMNRPEMTLNGPMGEVVNPLFPYYMIRGKYVNGDGPSSNNYYIERAGRLF